MGEKLSVQTLSTCLLMLESELRRLKHTVMFFHKIDDLPYWMVDSIASYEQSINELKKYLGYETD